MQLSLCMVQRGSQASGTAGIAFVVSCDQSHCCVFQAIDAEARLSPMLNYCFQPLLHVLRL